MRLLVRSLLAPLAAALIAVGGAAPPAEAVPISVLDLFRIGSGSNVLCTAQISAADPAWPSRITEMAEMSWPGVQ